MSLYHALNWIIIVVNVGILIFLAWLFLIRYPNRRH